MTRSSEEPGFLGRWARRKEQVRRGERPEEEPAGDGPAEREVGQPAAAEESEAAPLTDADMPDLDTLRPDSDVSPFFSPGVSEELRHKALRRLFHTSRFNVKDGLDDYDDDYRAHQPLGDIVTRDMRRQQERLAERRRLREEAEAAEARADAERAGSGGDEAARAPEPDAGEPRAADTDTAGRARPVPGDDPGSA